MSNPMKKIIIKSQDEFDKIKRVNVDEEVIFESKTIQINCVLEVFGILRLTGEIKSSWNNQYIITRESSQAHLETRGSSQAHLETRESSQAHLVTRGSSQAHLETRDSSQAHLVTWDSSQIKKLLLFGFSVVSIPFDFKFSFKKSKNAKIQRYRFIDNFFEREGIKKTKKVILFKRVSKDFKTQEDIPNETLWAIDSTVEHKEWKPESDECGAGKFHAVSRPYFGDEFRSTQGDKYVAIEIKIEDLYEWKKPEYPHKIGFRAGKVLYECDRYGNKI